MPDAVWPKLAIRCRSLARYESRFQATDTSIERRQTSYLNARSLISASFQLKFNVIIDVVSPTGIGRAKITTTTGQWPQRLIFRFHLQALEGFQVSANNHLFSYSLEPEENTSRYNQAQAGQKLEPIEVELPSAWLKEAPNSLNIQWVDWYR